MDCRVQQDKLKTRASNIFCRGIIYHFYNVNNIHRPDLLSTILPSLSQLVSASKKDSISMSGDFI